MVGISSNYNSVVKVSTTTSSLSNLLKNDSLINCYDKNLSVRTLTGEVIGTFDKIQNDPYELLKTNLSSKVLSFTALASSKDNGFSYEGNYIAASFIGFHEGAQVPTDKQKAQDSRAAIVEAVSNYDKAKNELDEISEIYEKICSLKAHIEKGFQHSHGQNPIPPRVFDELRELLEKYPNIDKSLLEAQNKANEAEENLSQAQANYKEVYGQSADLSIVRKAISETKIINSKFVIEPRLYLELPVIETLD